MKKIPAALAIIFILTSCNSFNKKQKDLILEIERQGTLYISEDLSHDLKNNFNGDQAMDLTGHDNPYVRCLFFSLIADHYPQSIYQTVVNHLRDTARVDVQTNYDTMEYMTIANYMIWKTQKSEHISEQQRENLNDSIIFNYDRFWYLNDNALAILMLSKEAKPKYYNFIRTTVIEKSKNFNINDCYLLHYLARFKKPEDIKIISSVLETIFSNESIGNISASPFLYNLIRKYPSDEYLPILLDFYSKKLRNRKSRCDEYYCELEQFIEALLAFPTPETEQTLYNLSDSKLFISQYNSGVITEYICFWARKTDNSYYQPLLKNLEKRINGKVYNKISKTNENLREL